MTIKLPYFCIYMFFMLLSCHMIIALESYQATPITIKIGAILESKNEMLVEAFNFALDKYNFNDHRRNRFRLSGQIEFIKENHNIRKSACKLLADGVVAILGLNSRSIGWYLESLSHHFHIPYIQIPWDSGGYLSDWTDPKSELTNFTVTLTPLTMMIGRALNQWITHHGHWKRFILIYESDQGLLGMKKLFEINSFSRNVQITVRRYQPTVNTFKKLLRDCKKHGETNFIINLANDKIIQFLNEAQRAGLMTEYNNFFLYNLDIGTIDFRSFEWIDTNITAFSLVDQQSIDREEVWTKSDFFSIKRTKLKVVTALIYDGIKILAESIKNILKGEKSIETPRLTCDSNKFWSQGDNLMFTIKMNSFSGLTGPIGFNQFGSRINFQLDVIKLRKGAFFKIGHWSPDEGLTIVEDDETSKATLMDKLHRKTFRVNSILSRPYLMLKRHHEQMIGNEKFEGLVIDLMDTLQTHLNFTSYTIFLGKDGSGGSPYGNGSWSDVIGNLVNQKADLALGDLTITQGRSSQIDFTFPIINFGISMITAKPDNMATSLTAFLNPFSSQLWLGIGCAFLWVTVIMYFIGRFSPIEWIKEDDHRIINIPSNSQIILSSGSGKIAYAKNNFGFINCAWFALCSIMQQSSNLNLRAISTRTLATSWWFFTLIIISSYTANLAAYLTSSKLDRPIESLDALISQNKITFGCVKYGATYNFFKKSPDPVHQRLINVMSSTTPSVFTESTNEGLKRVLNGNYVFFMESTSILYYTHRYCNLTQIGAPLDDRGYGIGLPLGSPYKSIFTETILWMRETQVIDRLKAKWFHEQPKQERLESSIFPIECSMVKTIANLNQLQVVNIGGILIVLLIGSAVASILVVIEFIWKTKTVSKSMSNNKKIDESRNLLTFETLSHSGIHLETVI